MKTPYKELLPPLSTEEFEALKADIKEHGVRVPIDVDEDGNILDGHHRYKIDKDCPRKVIKGLSEGEKRAFVFRANFMRRNLSPEEKNDARRRMKETAEILREEDAKKWTQATLASVFGVARETIRDWFLEDNDGHNGESANTPAYKSKGKPKLKKKRKRQDARVKIPAQEKPIIADRIEAGESISQVAADYKVSQRQIKRIHTEEMNRRSQKAEREQAAAKIKGDCGVLHGDFRKLMPKLEDESVAMIFTDPPYDEASISIYGDIAELAAKKLMKSGWMLAYCGKSHLPHAMEAMRKHLEYGWTFAIFHSGGNARFRNLKIQTGWKPIIGVYRKPLDAAWDWFPDTISGGQEKADHEWQQALSEAEHFIKVLCPKGGLVLDPCCGSGTSLLAAKNLHRKWLGYDIDENATTVARTKLA